jgi:hypothetical protein
LTFNLIFRKLCAYLNQLQLLTKNQEDKKMFKDFLKRLLGCKEEQESNESVPENVPQNVPEDAKPKKTFTITIAGCADYHEDDKVKNLEAFEDVVNKKIAKYMIELEKELNGYDALRVESNLDNFVITGNSNHNYPELIR